MLKKENLHNYQLTTVDHVIQVPKCGVLLDMGLGKTISILTAVNVLMYEELEVDSVLVIAPKRVAENVWTDEIANWEHVKHLKISRVIGTAKQREASLREKADIHIISRDNIVWLCGLFGGGMLPFDMLVIDESSSFKNPKSKRFKALKLVQPSFKRVVLLTGTPAPNGLLDLWSQIYLLDRGERLGKTLTSYRYDYFRPDKRNGARIFNYKIRNSAADAIHNKIKDICISMQSEDYLDLPGVVVNHIKIDLGERVQKKYDDFEKEQVLKVFEETEEEGEEISVVNAAALSSKLLQFASGAVYDEDKNWHTVHDKKIEALKEIVEAAGGKPVLVAYAFKHELFRIMEALEKYEPRKLEKSEDIRDWNDGKLKVMIMHPASGGHGLNLQSGGNIVVWFGLTWSLELYQQFNKRLDRQGQKEVVVINHLVARKTIDARVISSLSSKDANQHALLKAVKAIKRKYLK